MPNEKYKAFRKIVRGGRVLIGGKWWRPNEQKMRYDGRLDGNEYLFKRFKENGKYIEKIALWGTREQAKQANYKKVPSCKEITEESFPWYWWYPEYDYDQSSSNSAVKTIPLSRGYVAIVDAEDYDRMMQYSWHAVTNYGITRPVTAVRGKRFFMHNLIMGKKGLDHINRDGLDNRKCNLRPCTTSQNGFNVSKRKGKNPYKGISWNKRDKRWTARLCVHGRMLHLGNYKSPEDAARAYDKAAYAAAGEFAYLNFPLPPSSNV